MPGESVVLRNEWGAVRFDPAAQSTKHWHAFERIRIHLRHVLALSLHVIDISSGYLLAADVALWIYCGIEKAFSSALHTMVFQNHRICAL